jgi:Fe2+ or Zn2+ uptake regulation protein
MRRRNDTLHRREVWLAARELMTAKDWTLISIEEIETLCRVQQPNISDRSVYACINRLVEDGLLKRAKVKGLYRVIR